MQFAAAIVFQLDWVGVVFDRAFGIWGRRITDVVGGIAVEWVGGKTSGIVSSMVAGWVDGREVGGMAGRGQRASWLSCGRLNRR